MYVYQDSDFLVAEVTDSMRFMAQAEYENKFRESNKVNGHTVYQRAESRIAGILGELVFAEIYPDAIRSGCCGYDFKRAGQRIDVKCKCRHVPPRLQDEASVFVYQNHGEIDSYYFMSTMPDYKLVWLCGWIEKTDFLTSEHLEHWLPGQIDRDNGMTFRAETYAIRYKYLEQIRLDKLVRDPVR